MISTKRIVLFLIGCIGTRLLFVFLAKRLLQIPNKYSNMLPLGYLFAGIGILSIYFFKLRNVGSETFGEPIWWNQIRPLHGFLWITYAIAAYYKLKTSWIILLADTLIGFIAWINKRLL